MRFTFALFVFVTLCFSGLTQNPRLVSGPMQGAASPHSTQIWLMVSHIRSVKIAGQEAHLTQVNDTLYAAQREVAGLPPGRHEIDITIKGRPGTDSLTINKEVFIPDSEIGEFSFLLGSCTFPHKPRNKRWHIFDEMARIPTDFMMWMGDNIYLILGDWNSKQKINNRYVRYRMNDHLNGFLATRPNFAAWDDHDFGPNNSGADFELKDSTLQAFKDFWANPAYGTDSLPGTFYSFQWQDAAFFVLDGRYHKTDEQMYGHQQMEWLKQGLRDSPASVKFIVGGCQFLVQPRAGENWGDYPQEKDSFLQFVKEEQIKGITFLSGDRHLAELTVLEDWDGPKMLEMTSSPMTSFVNHTFGNKNPNRVKGTLAKKLNFGKITLFGQGQNRSMQMQLLDKKARTIWTHTFLLSEL